MSQLQLLKIQLEQMDSRIQDIEKQIMTKSQLLREIELKKEEIDYQLLSEKLSYEKLTHNYEYLLEIKKDTSSNYNQIEEAATTLLDIIKSKCDAIV